MSVSLFLSFDLRLSSRGKQELSNIMLCSRVKGVKGREENVIQFAGRIEYSKNKFANYDLLRKNKLLRTESQVTVTVLTRCAALVCPIPV